MTDVPALEHLDEADQRAAAIKLAYGLLWLQSNYVRGSVIGDAAQRELGKLLDADGQARGIKAARESTVAEALKTPRTLPF
jgi:hypothetical protein